MTVIGVQRRFMQLGRVRLGEKGPKGEPKRLGTFRFTSASERLLQAVAARYGGAVTAWEGAPDEGYFQVTTEATELDIILPPTFNETDGTPSTSYSQYYELWSKGGCQRRCDGITESLTGDPCMCDPAVRDAGSDPKGTCGIVTRVSFIIPDLPGLGVWRLDSGGWNAAVELPGTLELLAQAASEQRFIPAVLALQNRTRKAEGQTRRFVVPVIELPDVTIGQLVGGTAPSYALNAPATVPKGRPEIAAAPVPPNERFVHEEEIPFGDPPTLPVAPPDPVVADGIVPDADASGAGATGISEEEQALIDTLLQIAEKKGVREKAEKAVMRNREANLDDPAKRIAYLQGQLKRAQETP